jgi:acyl-CoA thioesterase FadM
METNGFVKKYEVTWEQLDPLGHLRAPVLLDYVLNTQMSWITHFGYGQTQLSAAGYDPVILKLEARYHHEALLGETLNDVPQLAGLSPDGSMWKTYHQVSKPDGEKVATIKLEGTWFNWKSKQAIAPEAELLAVLMKVEKTASFESMRSIIRSTGP